MDLGHLVAFAVGIFVGGLAMTVLILGRYDAAGH